MKRLACLGFLLVTAASTTAAAQSLYLPNGASGIGVAGAVSTNERALDLSVAGGYSWKTFIDAGAFLHRYSYSDTGSLTVSAIGFQPYVTLHALRQSDTVPVSLAATANYQHLFFSVSDNPEGLSITGWSMFVGGYVYRRFGLPGPWSLTPQVTVGFESTQTTNGVRIVADAPTDSAGVFRIDGNLAYQVPSGRVWLANPFVSFGTGGLTAGISVGATFPLRR